VKRVDNKSWKKIYDATYLELAIREKIPLITSDKMLISAAEKLQIPTRLK